LLTADLAVVGGVLLLVRGGVLAPTSRSGALLYRLSIYVAMLGSFFQLHYILPTITSRVVDADLYAFDMRVFGFEPAVVWDQFVTATTTEWFAFFYYGYFFVLALHLLPIAFLSRDKQLLSEASLGIVTVFTVGHLLYIAVPGYGPYAYLAGQFQHELHGGLWWPLVRHAVDSAGARKDIFPSLHTAAPTFLALLSLRHRKRLPFRFTWPFAILFASQIVIATMFLRWHYLIDVCAGLALAATSLLIAARVARWEKSSRERRGLAPVWMAPHYFGSWSTRG